MIEGSEHMGWRARLAATATLVALAVGACEPATPTATSPDEPDLLVEPSPPLFTGPEQADISAWRPFELEGTWRPPVLFSHEAEAEDRMLALMAAAHDGGTSGFYLREIGGPVHLAENETFVFEPASTIKAIIHFHAMRQVQLGTVIDGALVALTTPVPNGWAGSCPQPITPFFGTLQVGLTAMMDLSDNPWTQAFRDFFGDASIDQTRQAFGMNNSGIQPQHILGCGATAIANPNQLTLVDAGLMYEAVATGFLTGDALVSAYGMMDTDEDLFNTMIDEEADGLDLSAAAIDAFKAGGRSVLKGGSYTLIRDGVTQLYRSVAGRAVLAFRDTSCAVDPREYVYGAFIHGADGLTGLGIRALGVETFREEVRHGLESWAACGADLGVSDPVVLDLDDPMDANRPYAFTVRHTAVNLGPAESIDAVLTMTYDFALPADCTVSPTGSVQPLTLDRGVAQHVDVPVTLTCTSPSNHRFFFRSSVEPENPAVVDTDPTNNTATTSEDREVIAWADLATVGSDLSELDDASPWDLLVGQLFWFNTVKTLRNHGDTELGLYFDPAEVRVRRSMAFPEGVTGWVRVGPDELSAQVVIQVEGQPDLTVAAGPGSQLSADGPARLTVVYRPLALPPGENREIDEQFGLQCMASGAHPVQFDHAVEAVDPHLLDPDPDNNTLEAEREIDCVLPVQINVRPGNQHNWVNPGSNESLPVAVLTTEAGEYGLPASFDATTILPDAARFGTVTMLGAGGGSSASRHFVRDSFEMDDMTRDGDLDMVLHFGIPGSGADAGTVEMCVVGRFLAAGGAVHTYFGCDAVQPQAPTEQ